MMHIVYFLLVLFISAVLYICSLQGRTGNPELSRLRGWKYAHRGLYGNGVPENSLWAFRLAVEHHYGAEFDVHLLADGGLGIMHDSKLERMTGKKGTIEELSTDQLKNYTLLDTEEVIPTLQQVLEVFSGSAPVIIELKSYENNPADLCRAVCEVLDHYDGVYCLESFDPRCVIWLKKHRPDLLRGQLSENYFLNSNSRLPILLKWLLRYNMANFLGKPDFIAYEFQSRKTISNFICRKFWKLEGVSWTLKSEDDYNTAISEDWIPIFEKIRP